MRNSALRLSLPTVLRLGLFCAAALPVSPAADDALAQQARATMEKATAFMRSISTEGGYLWRYSTDLSERAGEEIATATQIWVQPPGTPSMGMAFLRAHEATGDARYLDAAKAAADALAVGQLASGGWDYVIEFDPKLSTKWYRRSDIGKLTPQEAAKRKNISTYDDNNTQSALRLLLAVADASNGSNSPRDMRIRDARDYALKKLLEAQRPNGGWPQRWDGVRVNPADYPVQPARFPADYPRQYPKTNYMGHYTLNDNTQRDCVMTLLDAGKRLRKPEYRAAALRGGDFLLLAQMPEPQPAWAQQYNAQLEPAWARAFEPPCVCSGESVGAIRLLVDLYLETGEQKYLEPVPRAIAWFKRSEIAPNTWARMYELRTNKPIYGDRDGKIYYRVEELSPERQTGYSWKSSYGAPAAFAHYEAVKQVGREAFLAKHASEDSFTPKQKAERAKNLEPRVREIIAALDAEGRWTESARTKRQAFHSKEEITMQRFIANLRVLSDYVDGMK